ncbi:unnamed protein product [Sphenostylis stenocarpa]|uniref:AB hydrolase-1 domain-containing protein n=1 Tax=Sphenostylis stenocarpa TaxID=92480 RepID=A0AA86SW34_9FABA|nr:unnamed protein product [Sphenostylis stenocarpa]
MGLPRPCRTNPYFDTRFRPVLVEQDKYSIMYYNSLAPLLGKSKRIRIRERRLVRTTIAAGKQERKMMKVASPLPTGHVRILLSHTCLRHSIISTKPRKSRHYYKLETHGEVEPSQPHSHSKFQTTMAKKEGIDEAQSEFRSKFLQVLRSRRPAQVPLTVELAKPVANPLHQNSPPTKEEIQIMESCPKADTENLEGLLEEEYLYLNIEEGEQGRLPMLILKLKESDKQGKRPAVVFLHSTNKYKELVRPLLKAYASWGYIAISVDSRCHGERATCANTYQDALVSAWKTADTMPFIYDTVWDLIKLADYLTQREDIDPSRIGITGISLGGMHAWFAAVADTRYAVVVPLIGVQGFRWAIDNDKWKGRVESIKPLFEAARNDLGKDVIDKEVVQKVWDRIAPGLASQFDSPYSIPAIAPRPLLILNGAEDPRCPVEGLEVPMSKASQAYEEFQCLDNLKVRTGHNKSKNFIAEPGVGHQLTRFQVKESLDWFNRFLKP